MPSRDDEMRELILFSSIDLFRLSCIFVFVCIFCFIFLFIIIFGFPALFHALPLQMGQLKMSVFPVAGGVTPGSS